MRASVLFNADLHNCMFLVRQVRIHRTGTSTRKSFPPRVRASIPPSTEPLVCSRIRSASSMLPHVNESPSSTSMMRSVPRDWKNERRPGGLLPTAFMTQ
eukprot:46784-Eustigmatos_ZCMA.PRE.1